jgi:hypothetical protein
VDDIDTRVQTNLPPSPEVEQTVPSVPWIARPMGQFAMISACWLVWAFIHALYCATQLADRFTWQTRIYFWCWSLFAPIIWTFFSIEHGPFFLLLGLGGFIPLLTTLLYLLRPSKRTCLAMFITTSFWCMSCVMAANFAAAWTPREIR